RDMILGHISNELVHDGRPLRYWLRTLRSGDERSRENAAHALGQIGPESPDVLPALAQALGDEDYIVRKNAAVALGRIGPAARDTAPALIRALKDAEPMVRRPAARALGDIDPDPAIAVPALVEVVTKDADVATRVDAIGALG